MNNLIGITTIEGDNKCLSGFDFFFTDGILVYNDPYKLSNNLVQDPKYGL